jgi:2-amino-4-hydroxy-6-hydroxymethyldihydropteridine diphosphokinase
MSEIPKSKDWQTVYLSVGSNMGRKRRFCQEGIDQLLAHDTCRLIQQSPFYRTAPVDYLDQDWFVNAVVAIQTCQTPEDLLAMIHQVEQLAGRRRDGARYGPRVLDMDILLFGDSVIDLPQLKIPHPRMHKRRFVLQPICDINPEIKHPLLQKTMQGLLATLQDGSQEVVPY